jgi:cyanophycinase
VRGWIIPIGGAEEKQNDPLILQRFVELCGGENADIVVMPTASRLQDTGARYERIFRELGAADVTAVDFDTRRDCAESNRLDRIARASGVFFTGGNQLRITTLIGGTPVAKLIRERNAHGMPVAGTSAGAAFLSEHMIAFGEEGGSPRRRQRGLAPGLGLTNRFIIDQHFRQRDRLGRLTTALAFNPFAVGIGLDEDTAAFIGPDNTLEVEGSGASPWSMPPQLQFSSMDRSMMANRCACSASTSISWCAGATFNLHTRRASAGSLNTSKE